MVRLLRRVLAGRPAKRAVRRAWRNPAASNRKGGAVGKPEKATCQGECNNVQHQTCVNPRFLVIDIIFRKRRFLSFLRGKARICAVVTQIQLCFTKALLYQLS